MATPTRAARRGYKHVLCPHCGLWATIWCAISILVCDWCGKEYATLGGSNKTWMKGEPE